MLERSAKKYIDSWIQSGRDALLITGARQIGKTYLIKECLRESGVPYVELNFIDQPEACHIVWRCQRCKGSAYET